MDLSFTSLAVVAVVALVAPLALGLTGLRLPAIVLEILLGIAVGPQGLNWAHVDRPVEVMSLIGLAFLLLLAGLEVEYDRFRGRLLRLTALGYAISFGLALLVGLALRAGDLVKSPLLLAIILSATGLGVILPILKDAGATATPFGQVVIAGASIAEVVPIVLLSLFVVLASKFGLEVILGAFLAGATLKLLDRDVMMTHPFFRRKLEAVGFGVFVPFFFVATGMRLDVDSLFSNGSALARVPIFLGALLLIRGLPALVYRPLAESGRQLVAGGLLQATSLSLLIVAGQLGVELDLIRPENYTALVAAGLLSVIVFPLVALTLLRSREDARERVAQPAGPAAAES